MAYVVFQGNRPYLFDARWKASWEPSQWLYDLRNQNVTGSANTQRDYAYIVGDLISWCEEIGKSWSTLPDETFTKILDMCLQWISRADYILNLHNASLVVAEKAAWGKYALGALFKDPSPFEDGFSISNSRELTTAVSRLQTACVLLIHTCTGMRQSEVASMRNDAVVRETHEGVEYWSIRSVHTKFSEDFEGNEETWLCGREAAKAHEILVRISAHYRSRTGSPYVICPTRRLSFKALARKKDESRYGRDYVRSLFAHHSHAILPRMLRMAGIVDDAGRPFRIKTHQCRRTFARCAARVDSITIHLALKDHFKHASLLMTSYYAYVDDELLVWFEEERNQAGIESFDRILTAEALGGVGGLAIMRELNQAVARGDLNRQFRGTAFRNERVRMIKQWLAAGIYPRLCSGHFCVPRDPHFDCASQGGGFGCNEGVCANAVYLPEHAPLLAIEVNEETELLAFMEKNGYGSIPYTQNIRESIRAKRAHLATISTTDEASPQIA